jgi:hypothetical protein
MQTGRVRGLCGKGCPDEEAKKGGTQPFHSVMDFKGCPVSPFFPRLSPEDKKNI